MGKAYLEILFSIFHSTRTNEHLMSLNCRTWDKKKHFFHMVCNRMWDSLPQDVIEVKSRAGFKEELDIQMNNKDIGI